MVSPSSDRIPRAPPYSRIISSPSPTGLSPSSIDLSMSFRFLPWLSIGWSDFARHYSRSLGWFPFLQVLRCFSSPRSLCIPMYSECNNHCWLGSPIRTSADQRLFTAPHGFSQCITSFFASDCQGIHQMPLPIAWFLQYKHFAFTICSYHLNKKSFLPVILSNFGVYFYTFFT